MAHTQSQNTPRYRTVIVIGASMAGLLAARVLADHAEQVLVIDRDRLPTIDGGRAGVPQGRHVHGMLARGLALVRQLFPGIDADFDAIDAPRAEWGNQTMQLLPYGWTPRYASGIFSRSLSRPALESIVRRRVRALPQVTFRERTDILDLVIEDGRVVGVQVRPRGTTEAPTILRADAVVVASGRSSPLPEWLNAHGFAAPPVTVIDAKLKYASREYAIAPEQRPDWAALLMLTRAEHPRGGVITEIEGGRWLMTLAGVGDAAPTTDEAGFAAFVATLPVPELHALLKHAVPLTPIYGYARTANIRHHYEQIDLPAGLFAIGDAVCAFNPVYGQGMTAAALAAETLAHTLRAGRDPVPRTFQRALAHALDDLWLMATSEDLRYAHTVDAAGRVIGGRATLRARIQNAYLDLLFRAAPHSPAVSQALLEVLHLLRPPLGLFRPDALLPALRMLFTRRPALYTDASIDLTPHARALDMP